MMLPVPANDARTPRDRMMAAIDEIAARHGLTREQVMTKAKRMPKIVVAARTEVYAMLYDFRGPYRWSLSRIGAYFERDHTTIMHALQHASDEVKARYDIAYRKGVR